MESPYKEIVIFVCGGGLITGVIALSKEIRERVAEKRKQKREEADAHLSNTVELQRLENESDKAAWERLEKENERINRELNELRESPTMSFAARTKCHQKYRELGVKIDKQEMQISRKMPHKDLLDSINQIKKSYDELGEMIS